MSDTNDNCKNSSYCSSSYKGQTLEELNDLYPKDSYCDPNINSSNFPKPDKVETQNWKLIEIPKGETWTSEKCLEKIKEQKCRPANIYELLVWSKDNQKKGTWVIALGSKWIEENGFHRVPGVYRYDRCSGLDFYRSLGGFERPWRGSHAILSFCDLQTSESLPLKKELEPSDTQAIVEAINKLTKAVEKLAPIKPKRK